MPPSTWTSRASFRQCRRCVQRRQRRHVSEHDWPGTRCWREHHRLPPLGCGGVPEVDIVAVARAVSRGPAARSSRGRAAAHKRRTRDLQRRGSLPRGGTQGSLSASWLHPTCCCTCSLCRAWCLGVAGARAVAADAALCGHGPRGPTRGLPLPRTTTAQSFTRSMKMTCFDMVPHVLGRSGARQSENERRGLWVTMLYSGL